MDTLSYKTLFPNAQAVEHDWVVIDATDQVLGRLCAKVAKILRGKYKPSYSPNVECGDNVIIINADKAILTGKKLDNKYYRRHTGYIGSLKEVQYRTLMRTRPEMAMQLAVKGMVPDTTIGRSALTRLRVYKGTEHKHQAQKPEAYTL